MKKTVWLVLAGLSLVGCSTVEQSSNQMPWYDDLNPATDQTISDWYILDMDVASYQQQTSAAEEVWSDTVLTFW